MAGDTSFLSTSTCMALFFSLILVFRFTMAVPEHNFSPLTSTSTSGGAKKIRNTVVASAREGTGTQNSKTGMITRRETLKGIHVPNQLQGSKRGRSRAPRRSPLQWRNRIFNASAHEVPSGPNPISNR